MIREAITISLIQHFEADSLWKVSLKILNSGKVLKTFIHVGMVPRLKVLSDTLDKPGIEPKSLGLQGDWAANISN